MDEDGRDDKLKAERRAFLEKCGRFAAVTPPVVTLMLAVGEKTTSKALAASGPTTTTTTTTTTGGPTPTSSPSVPVSPTQGMLFPGAPNQPPHDTAMIIDSMGLMKII